MTANDGSASLDLERARHFLRFGGVCAVVGGVGFLASGGLHGNLPGDTEAALRYLAPRSDWTAVHLTAMVSATLWIPAFAGLAISFRDATGWMLSRLAVASVLIGVAVFVVDYSIDGYALKHMADDWAAAAEADRQTKLVAADAVFGVVRGTVRASLIWLFGMPFLLIGLALARGRGWPHWLGWVAAMAGGGTVLAGMAAYIRNRPEDPLFLIGILLSFVSFVWLAVIGVVMWRHADRLPVRP